MSHIHIIDGGTTFGLSQGQLNHTLAATAVDTLQLLGHKVTKTRVIDDYDCEHEVAQFLAADSLILQMPAWWMGEPWTVKKYIDEVLSLGHGSLYANDGRSRADRDKHYGSGGLLQGKHYLLSLTWNAPLQAFTDKDQFFEGIGVDGLYLHTHKAFQFLGMTPHPTFICNDVIKQPDIPTFVRDYQQHLTDIFGQV
ncbi:NAD(P)H-dependent oxidoreductase [Rosenbergiella australiborealis]|uniref:NAD(P)H-dependent oxidoreductase n=1 Tax=Rosenbergiella australiborealis TaxID=1544696 RepID=A0ABS5T6H3_9GAMM|nr:NAD(P)H-dependent oxidoreductase [Rosenbergiella australiborealis]MBT0727110.1 NAD(P)H-dependent oxidoreductase [Rosenbergiella australiborealis]